MKPAYITKCKKDLLLSRAQLLFSMVRWKHLSSLQEDVIGKV